MTVLGFYHSGDNGVLENIRGGNAHGGGNRSSAYIEDLSRGDHVRAVGEGGGEGREEGRETRGLKTATRTRRTATSPTTKRITSHSTRRDHSTRTGPIGVTRVLGILLILLEGTTLLISITDGGRNIMTRIGIKDMKN